MAADVIQLQVVPGDALPTRTRPWPRAPWRSGTSSELDVDDVVPVTAGEAPAGAKGIELLALGGLLIRLGRSSHALRQVVDAIRDWVGRTEARSVRMTVDGDVLEVTGATGADVKQLIDAGSSGMASTEMAETTRAPLVVAAYEFEDPKFQGLRSPARDVDALADARGSRSASSCEANPSTPARRSRWCRGPTLTCDLSVTSIPLLLTDDDHVFRALADPTRRLLLDRLYDRDGRTLTALESQIEMTRFGVLADVLPALDARRRGALAGHATAARSGRDPGG